MLILKNVNILPIIGFDALGNVSLSNGIGFGKNVILFGADVSSLVHIDNKKKFLLIYLSLDDAILTA